MNNSRIALEYKSPEQEKSADILPLLKEREGTLVRIIEAIRVIKQSVEWGTLKTELFDDLAKNLERDLKIEARADQPDTLKLNRLAGQLKWAERFTNLDKLENTFLVELKGIRFKLENHG